MFQLSNSKQQTANSKQQTLTAALFATFILLVCATSLQAQIKVWSNNHTSVGYSTSQPNEQLNVTGDFYLIPNGTSASGGFYFENYHHNLLPNHLPNPDQNGPWFDEPILKPLFGMSMWLGNSASQLYSVYSRTLYHSNGIYSFSDQRLKTNIIPMNRDVLDDINKINVYTYDMDPSKFGNLPEGKSELLMEDSKNKIGFLAQEIQQVFPELVKGAGESGFLAVNYEMMIPILLEAIKEQQKLIIELQERVEALENK
jgi:hypothetical protein